MRVLFLGSFEPDKIPRRQAHAQRAVFVATEGLLAKQIDEFAAAFSMDRGEGDFEQEIVAGDIVKSQNGLFVIKTMTKNGEAGIGEIKDALRSMRVEGSDGAAGANHVCIAREKSTAEGMRIVEFSAQDRVVEFFAVDGTGLASLAGAVGPVARAEERMDIDSGDTGKNQGHALRTKEPSDFDVGIGRSRGNDVGIVEGVEIVDVEFVRDRVAGLVGFGGDMAAMARREVYEGLEFVRSKTVSGGSDADAVVAGSEVEKGGVLRRRTHLLDVLREIAGVRSRKRIQKQGRQREVINEVRFVAAVAEVGDVLLVRDIRFCKDKNVRKERIEHKADDADDEVGLG